MISLDGIDYTDILYKYFIKIIFKRFRYLKI
mgnify:CR=1 FL=1